MAQNGDIWAHFRSNPVRDLLRRFGFGGFYFNTILSEQRPGVGRGVPTSHLRAAPGSADRLAAASSPLLRERVPDDVFGVRHVLDTYAVAAGEQHHAPREPEGPWLTSSPARALCWLAAAEQQVVFDARRDHRLPARSAHHWQVRVRWWRLPPPNATSEWTGDERAHCLCTKKSVPRRDAAASLRGRM